MSKHTPGPWRLRFDPEGGYDTLSCAWIIFTEDQNPIVVVDKAPYLESNLLSQEPHDNSELLEGQRAADRRCARAARGMYRSQAGASHCRYYGLGCPVQHSG